MHNWHWWWFIIVNGQVWVYQMSRPTPPKKTLYFPIKILIYGWFSHEISTILTFASLHAGHRHRHRHRRRRRRHRRRKRPRGRWQRWRGGTAEAPAEAGSRDVKSVGIKKHGIYWYLLTVSPRTEEPKLAALFWASAMRFALARRNTMHRIATPT